MARTTALATVVAAVLLAVPAHAAAAAPCTTPASGGEWPSYGHDPANTRTQPAEHGLGPAAVAGLTPAWVFSSASTGDGSVFNATPVVNDGCVFVGDSGGYVYALDARSGHVVWEHRLQVSKPGFGGAIVGAAAVSGNEVVFLVSEEGAPYAVALDRTSGALLWRSAPFTTQPGTSIQGYYTNASPVIANGLVVAGYSPPEGDPHASGGFALIDAATGAIVKVTPTIPPADQAKGYAGGGLWSTPAYDPATKYLYFGAGNPGSKTKQHRNTDAILKIDLDRSRPTFGEIVAAYDGNVDQYLQTLQALSQTPVCAASDNPSVPYPLDDPACGQLDLDFGAAPNLFRLANGTEVVGELQKSGVYHVARADSMQAVWSRLVGASCQACNLASTAFDGSAVEGVATPGGTMYSLARDTGTINWLAPIGDVTHYQSTSAADGVVWTVDGGGFLDAYDAASGKSLLRRSMSVDARGPVSGSTSSGVAIAEHSVFAAAGGSSAGGGSATPGYVIAYRPGG